MDGVKRESWIELFYCLMWYDHVFADRCSKTVFGPAYRVALTTAYTGGAVEAVMRSRLRPRLRPRSNRSTRSPGPGRIRSPNGGFHSILYSRFKLFLFSKIKHDLNNNYYPFTCATPFLFFHLIIIYLFHNPPTCEI